MLANNVDPDQTPQLFACDPFTGFQVRMSENSLMRYSIEPEVTTLSVYRLTSCKNVEPQIIIKSSSAFTIGYKM